MFRSILFVLAFAAVAFAAIGDLPAPASSAPGSSNLCARLVALGDWELDDKTSSYTKDFKGEMIQCRRKYITTCRTRTGVVPCNDWNQKCVKISKNVAWDDKELHPNYVNRVTERPQVCVSRGTFMQPDAGVSMVAIIIVGWIIITIALVLVVKAVKAAAPSLPLNFALFTIYVLATIMMFSYYYLNAVLCLAAMFAAYSLFSLKRADATAFAFVFVFLALFWVTFENGLGYVQHNSRFSANYLGSQERSQYQCHSYYRGYFMVIAERLGDFDNPSYSAHDFCNREFLATELFCMILTEILLGFTVIAGAASHFAPATVALPPKEEPETAAAAEGEAATEMENKA